MWVYNGNATTSLSNCLARLYYSDVTLVFDPGAFTWTLLGEIEMPDISPWSTLVGNATLRVPPYPLVNYNLAVAVNDPEDPYFEDLPSPDITMDNNWAMTTFPGLELSWVDFDDGYFTGYEIKILNPLFGIEDVNIWLYPGGLGGWAKSAVYTLTADSVGDPDFVQIDPTTYVYQNLEPGEEKTLTFSASTMECDFSDTVYIAATINDSLVGGVTAEIFPSRCPIVRIEKTHGSLQGHFENVSITTEGGVLEMGGFDFLISYDASALSPVEVNPGQFLNDCGWEYFTYRYGVQGNCGNACPSGLLRIIAMAETNNGPNHPDCYGPPDCDEHELAAMEFFVTNNRTYNCQFAPISFFWDDCMDNAISSVDGECLYIDRAIYNFDSTLIWDEEDDDLFPEDARIPFVGAPDYCLNPDPDKPSACRCPVFMNGGIDIICADSIDAKGDINCNRVRFEIADAVMFTKYFIFGVAAFGDHWEASVAASDVNNDGIPLTVADLVALIRVIQGDMPPDPKPTALAGYASVSSLVNHSAVALSVRSNVDIGGGYFEFEYTGYDIGEPHLINGASDMKLEYGIDNGILRVIVYSMEQGMKIPGGDEHIFAVPISGEGEITLSDVQLSDYYGTIVPARIVSEPVLPASYALHQSYPNPFNATTTIMYGLPVATHVKLDIFNAIGQQVTTLVDRDETAGIHSITWDGTNTSGEIVASGVYLYRLSTNNFSAERKMILMK